MGRQRNSVKKIIQIFIFICVVLVSGRFGMAQENGVLNNEIGLRVGTMAPDFTGETYRGTTVKLSELYKDGLVVLILYRGAWCPYCNVHLRSFQEKFEEFKSLDANILAVSVDKPQYAQKTVQDDALSFEVISDPSAEILEKYNAIYRVPDDLADKYLNEYKIDLEMHSGRKDHVIAVPATYVIDTTGKIAFAYTNVDYKVRTEPEEVLNFLRELNKQ